MRLGQSDVLRNSEIAELDRKYDINYTGNNSRFLIFFSLANGILVRF